MKNKKKIILIGGGGHCKSCIDVIEQTGLYNIAGIIDVKEKVGKRVAGYEIIGCDEDLINITKEFKFFLITIGQIISPILRVKIYCLLKQKNVVLPIIISPSAYIAKNVIIGEGTIIMHKVLVNTSVNIGSNCIINTGSIIEHDCIIGNNIHIAPGSIICGEVQIDDCTHIGAGTTIIEQKKVGKNSVIGAGSVVIDNINNDSRAFGIPCREKNI